MKRILASFFNTPLAVLIVSIIIAGSIGVYEYKKFTSVPAYQFAQVTSGIIHQGNPGAVQDITLGFVTGGKINSVDVTVGQVVKKGQVLASLDAGTSAGSLTQARAAYAAAQANYQKVINGATGAAIDVARASVNTAETSLAQAKTQQETLVENAHRALLNSTLIAESTSAEKPIAPAPTVSGVYTGTTEGIVVITPRAFGNGGYITYTGLATGTTTVNTASATPLAGTGLSVFFPGTAGYDGTEWVIKIPNTNAPNYLSNMNAYQQALSTQTQVLANAQAVVDQAQAALALAASAARPEDVASAKAQVDTAYGAMQIAESAYQNTVITSPGDGTVTAIAVARGQIAVANAPAIELSATSVDTKVELLIPKQALISRDGKKYVLVQSGTTTREVEVTIGVQDDTNVQILSGLTSTDAVALH